MKREAGNGKRSGFTAIELLIVVLLVGVLASVAVPSYISSVETSRAQSASALLVQIVHANHMFALDHQNCYLSGTLTTRCGSCNQACGAPACNLVSCQYLAPHNFDVLPYTFTLSGAVGTATRKSGYKGWGYTADIYGNLTPQGRPLAPLPAKI